MSSQPNSITQALENVRRAYRAGDVDGARRLCEQLSHMHPDAPDVFVMLGELDMRTGKLVSARQRLERAIALSPQSIGARDLLTSVLEELGDANAVLSFAESWAALMPDARNALARLAQAYAAAGDIQAAIETHRSVVARWPQAVDGYAGLAQLDPASIDDTMLRALEHIAANAADFDRAHALFALGNVLEQRQNYDEAFAYFSAGNRLRRDAPGIGGVPSPALGLTGEAFSKSLEETERLHATFVREAIAMYTPAFLTRFAGGGERSRVPVFVVGMPRSGSTLLEQILSNHPNVQGFGEAAVMSIVFRRALHASQRDPALADPPTFFRHVGAAYFSALADRGWDGQRRTLDKMLGNYIYVGAIHLTLPNAIILHSVRDPVDTCLSAFKQNFGVGNEASCDLGAVGRQYVRYREMIAHWDRVLPGRLITVEHERLIADPEAEIRKLVAACGLPWNEACLRYTENVRVVRTASVAQVRRPISGGGAQRWRNYERHLGPLFEALGPYAPK
jgi:tetratricopeptide (TPR) repeat protein